MTPPPRVSVIVPCYNAEEYVAETIRANLPKLGIVEVGNVTALRLLTRGGGLCIPPSVALRASLAGKMGSSLPADRLPLKHAALPRLFPKSYLNFVSQT